MAQLVGDVKNRVKRLPKPSNIADGLQPVFEAVSNAVHAISDLHGSLAKERGKVLVDFQNTKERENYSVTVSDNGIGLEDERFTAFCTTDTDFKIERGGKGVGRLLWLDAFSKTRIVSIYRQNGVLKRRSFDFGLSGPEPIYNESIEEVVGDADTGTVVTMTGLRSNSYASSMPVQYAATIKHFGSHFLADFLLGEAPEMVVTFEKKSASFPEAVKELLVETKPVLEFTSEQFGELRLDSYIMKPQASADLDGVHQLHLVSSGRTVQTRKIDGLIGVKRVGVEQDGVFHACVSGHYLDERVNQERTQFNFSEKTAEEITKECVEKAKSELISDEVKSYEVFRLEQLEDFVDLYPSFGFASSETLLGKTPINADNHEAFAKSLIPHKIRADKERRELVQSVLDRLTGDEDINPDLAEEIRLAAEEATRDENRQLMEYVLRRKFIIEILHALLGKVRNLNGNLDTHLENTFHQLICPMRVIGGDPARTEPVSHDLWLLDERLAPAAYFASDAMTKDFLDDDGKERVDLMVWDKIHGLGLGTEDRLERVLLVEFKRPERSSYKNDYVVGRQMNRYMERLKEGKIRSYNGEFVELSKDVVFHCYIVADLVGDIKTDTQGWPDSPSGRGKFNYLSGDFRGTMEVIEWKELVRDAKVRNQNFLEAASLSFTRKGDPIFKPKAKVSSEAAE
ncbi:ATP-binding protein [Rhodobacterales bacterium HKCCE4037]|nr:ATP-binding protein [Rhodobacterales bacterium HKCCE4037]